MHQHARIAATVSAAVTLIALSMGGVSAQFIPSAKIRQQMPGFQMEDARKWGGWFDSYDVGPGASMTIGTCTSGTGKNVWGAVSMTSTGHWHNWLLGAKPESGCTTYYLQGEVLM